MCRCTLGAPAWHRVNVQRVPGRLITISDIAELLVPTSPTGTMSRSRADYLTRHGPDFPAPVDVTRTGRIWDEDEVLAWITTHRGGGSVSES